MSVNKITGIVIKKLDYLENDSLITIFSPVIGINTYLVRRSRKASNKLSIVRQLFVHGTFIGKKPKGTRLGYINSIGNVSFFNRISTDIIKEAYAIHIAELLEKAFISGKRIDEWYKNFLIGLKKINDGLDPQIISNIFEIKLFPIFGVKQNLLSDPINHKKIGDFDYSEKFNGIISKENYFRDNYRLHANPKAVYFLRMFSDINIKKINSIKISGTVKRSLQHIINVIYDDQIGLKTNSRRFIEKMNTYTHKEY